MRIITSILEIEMDDRYYDGNVILMHENKYARYKVSIFGEHELIKDNSLFNKHMFINNYYDTYFDFWYCPNFKFTF